MSKNTIPVIDVFAGPGGLGEGFSALTLPDAPQPFRVVLSVEKDEWAHKTLRLRSFYRQFPAGEAPEIYYEVLQGKVNAENVASILEVKGKQNRSAWQAADREALHAELGLTSYAASEIRERIHSALGDVDRPWVLIGGPPCQAYSIVGRVRNRGIKNYRLEKDERHELYREYLKIIADCWPAVFVMENVKGLLSATVKSQKLFDRILDDLSDPASAVSYTGRSVRAKNRHTYQICAVAAAPRSATLFEVHRPSEFVVKCENYGIPQERHRVILIGIRDDVPRSRLQSLVPSTAPTVGSIIGNMPRLRSGLSRTKRNGSYHILEDSAELWYASLLAGTFTKDMEDQPWLRRVGDEVREQIVRTVSNLALPRKDRGSGFIGCEPDLDAQHPLRSWYIDERLGGVCNHETRLHLDTDLLRYLYAACYAKVHKESPKLDQFPAFLLPKHANAKSGNFDDRFRVQLAGRPATTIVSHIAKDGHYFIHPDPTQCRTLTVREVARLQTFPDNYFFCGPRTAQYVQVGNAVPPLLAHQIADRIWNVLVKSGMLQ